jgi:hypothetical protein
MLQFREGAVQNHIIHKYILSLSIGGVLTSFGRMLIMDALYAAVPYKIKTTQESFVETISIFVQGSYSSQRAVTYCWGSFLPVFFLLGIFFTASAMDEKSAVFLDSLDVPFIKIGSGDVNNLRLLKLGKRRTLQN